MHCDTKREDESYRQIADVQIWVWVCLEMPESIQGFCNGNQTPPNGPGCTDAGRWKRVARNSPLRRQNSRSWTSHGLHRFGLACGFWKGAVWLWAVLILIHIGEIQQIRDIEHIVPGNPRRRSDMSGTEVLCNSHTTPTLRISYEHEATPIITSSSE